MFTFLCFNCLHFEVVMIPDANDVNELVLEWQEDSPIIIDANLTLPQFDLLNVSTIPCEPMTYKTGSQYTAFPRLYPGSQIIPDLIISQTCTFQMTMAMTMTNSIFSDMAVHTT